ncbi:hypothetical protein AB4027_05365 [Alkalibacterium putridalgicola]|uniref:hypothetical protein n=1 Tax=Alkalibacterium putridalgicola TaxID=426703 RepID=UPI0034CEAB3F
MTIKWTRESFLILLTLIMILVGIFYYGNQILVVPAQESADSSSSIVNDQKALMEVYPPDENLLAEYEAAYEETGAFLPIGEQANEAIVRLEELAGQSSVEIEQVSRIGFRQGVPEAGDSYFSSSYQLDMTGTSPADFRELMDRLVSEERVWNVTSFTYEKSGGSNYTGTLIFNIYYYMEPTE